ncbi:MAG TPA: hypothetical protein VKE74_09730 [Gemmataceae bacterium]|nr:hypothetical protein [Gemmataceae bacterium]
MKRVLSFAVLASLTGCSNAPIAGFLDSCFPSRGVKSGPPTGGVPPGGVVPDVRPPGTATGVSGPSPTELPPPRNP